MLEDSKLQSVIKQEKNRQYSLEVKELKVTHWVKKYAFYPVWEGVAVTLFVLIAVNVTSYSVYRHSMNALRSEIRKNILDTTLAIAPFVDGDLHKQINAKGMESSKEYERAIYPLEKSKAAVTNIKYIYTIILTNDQVKFILDPTPMGLTNENGEVLKSYILEPYADATMEMMTALTNESSQVEKDVSADEFGAFISAYAPIHDRAGNYVATLGVDLDATDYKQRLEPIIIARNRAMVTGLFISILMGAFTWFLRQFAMRINQKRLNVFTDIAKLKLLNRSKK